MFANLLLITPKYYIYISIQTLYSVLCWSTFGSDYSFASSWVWCYKLGTPVFGEFLPFFSADPLKLCQVWWGASLHSYFQVSLEIGFKSGLWRCHSRTCPEATTALSWLCALGHCPVGRWTFAPVWGPERSGAGFNQGSLSTFHLSFDPD